jgi:hypothetical protein
MDFCVAVPEWVRDTRMGSGVCVMTNQVSEGDRDYRALARLFRDDRWLSLDQLARLRDHADRHNNPILAERVRDVLRAQDRA